MNVVLASETILWTEEAGGLCFTKKLFKKI